MRRRLSAPPHFPVYCAVSQRIVVTAAGARVTLVTWLAGTPDADGRAGGMTMTQTGASAQRDQQDDERREVPAGPAELKPGGWAAAARRSAKEFGADNLQDRAATAGAAGSSSAIRPRPVPAGRTTQSRHGRRTGPRCRSRLRLRLRAAAPGQGAGIRHGDTVGERGAGFCLRWRLVSANKCRESGG